MNREGSQIFTNARNESGMPLTTIKIHHRKKWLALTGHERVK
jgi:hypothetical protein